MPRIKGWKKVAEDFWMNTSRLPTGKQIAISIDKMQHKRDRRPYYYVYYYRKGVRDAEWGVVMYKKFKTKKEALKFVIYYIKRHPNG